MLDPNKIQLFQNNLEQISLGLNGNIEIINRSLKFAHKMEFGNELKVILDTLEIAKTRLNNLQQKVENFED
jgi:hypothetical protein